MWKVLYALYICQDYKNISYTAASICYNVLFETNRTICTIFKPRLTAGDDMYDVLCLSINFIIVGIRFKYCPKKVVQLKLYKIISDTHVTVICDSLK